MSDLLEGMIGGMSTENIFGGQDFFDQAGQATGRSTDNILGGEDLFDASGSRIGHSAHNIFGGEDFFDGSGQHVMSTREGVDGVDVFDSGGQQAGRATAFGDSVTVHAMAGHHTTWHANIFGGMTADPLTQVGGVEFPAFGDWS